MILVFLLLILPILRRIIKCMMIKKNIQTKQNDVASQSDIFSGKPTFLSFDALAMNTNLLVMTDYKLMAINGGRDRHR